LRVPLADGRYAVRVTIIGWDEEPNARDADGRPRADTLPDFVIRTGLEDGTESYRTNQATFDAPS
jgi:hypothetical protein